MRCNMIFLVMWCHWHWHWCHVMPTAYPWYHYILQVKMIEMRCNMTFWVMWQLWNQHQQQVIPTASSMAPFHFLGQDNQNEVQHDLLDMLYHWYWHHMMLTVSSMAPLYSFDEDNQNKVQHDFCSCYAIGSGIGIINATTAFLRSRQLKWGAIWFSWSYDVIGASVGSTQCWWQNEWNHYVSQGKII